MSDSLRIEALRRSVQRACLWQAPLWGLDELVAVNPFLGYSATPLLKAHAALARRTGADILPGLELARHAWSTEALTREDLAEALEEVGLEDARRAPALDVEALVELLTGPMPEVPVARQTLTVAASVELATGVPWREAFVGAISKYCAARFDRGLARFEAPLGPGGLYAGWREWARHDLSPHLQGLRWGRAWVEGLPESAEAALEYLTLLLGVEPADADEYFAALLGELPGWAGYVRRLAWAEGPEALGELPELLTIRLAYDAALCTLYTGAGAEAARGPVLVHRQGSSRAAERLRLARYVLLRAMELRYRRRLLGALSSPGHARQERPTAQAVFCIDVRSEPLRRHLELSAPGVETYGFAGFFGLPVEVGEAGASQARAQCPVLLRPAHRIGLLPAEAGPLAEARSQAQGVLEQVRRAANACFTYVETLGFGAAGRLLSGLMASEGGPEPERELDLSGLGLEARVGLARGLLENSGLGRPRARLLVLCGHESTSANNPQAASLACGACAGHSGALNARLAARLLNDAQVRQALAGEGLDLPSDCVAVAAVHETTTEVVRVLERGRVPQSHRAELAVLEQQLATAGARRRAERAGGLPGLAHAQTDEALLGALERRGRDWAEVRPEWGLAGNAAFLVGRRALSRGVDLEGRVFLHSYEPGADAEGRVLELILTAPVVVASWINLQYYASSVDGRHYGSGSKTVHNVVAGLGVLQGNGGDLAVGLSQQSLHDGTRPRHTPLRLQVLVEAPRARIDAVLARSSTLRDLVHNGWILLSALEAADETSEARGAPLIAWHFRPGAGWGEDPASQRLSNSSTRACTLPSSSPPALSSM